MHRHAGVRKLATAIFIAAVAIGAGSAQQPPRSAPGQAQPVRTIHGRVIADADGRALPYARVSVEAANTSAESDADGQFALSADRGTAAVSKTGFVTAHATLQDGMTVRLAQGALITGSVMDDVGAPWPTMVVVAERRVVREGEPHYERAATAETDDRGEYRLFDLHAGSYVVGIAGSRVPLPGSAAPAQPPLSSGPVRQYYPDALTRDDAQVFTLAAGTERPGIGFTVPMPPGMPITSSTEVRAGEHGAITGQVIGHDGYPERHARVTLTSVDSLFSPFRAPVNEDGRYAFAGVPAGRYVVAAIAPPYQVAAFGQQHPSDRGEIVTLSPRSVAEHVDIVMPRTGTVSGRVFDAHGEPLDRVTVTLQDVQWRDGRRRLVTVPDVLPRPTDDAGRFRLFSVPRGRYIVSASLNPSSTVGSLETFFPGTPSVNRATLVDVREGEDIDSLDIPLVAERGARMSGRVIGVDGQPFTGAVFLMSSARSNALAPPAPRRVKTEDGTFAFHNLEPGEYVVQAAESRSGESTEGAFGMAFVSVTNQDVDDVVVRLSSGSSLRGRFITESGVLIPDVAGLELVAAPSEADYISLGDEPVAQAAIDDDGTFALAGINGPRRLRLLHAPPGWTLKAVDVGGIDVTDEPLMFGTPSQSLDNVEIILTDREPQIGGAIIDADRRPVADATVVAFSVDPARWYIASRFIASAAGSSDGTFSMRGLPAGDYFFGAISNNGPRNIPDQLTDPDLLETVARHAIRVALPESGRVLLTVPLSMP